MASQEPLKANGLLNIISLMDLIDAGVIGWWNNQQTDASKKINMFPFKSEYIADLTKNVEQRDTNRIITYRKARKNYGSLTPEPFGSTKEVRARLREQTVINDNGETVGVKIFGRWYDFLMRFDCFAPTWSEAVQLEEDFDYLMDMFTGFIMRAGVNKMLYRGSYSDAFHYQTDYYYEPVTYYFRLERQYFTKDSLVREFNVNINNIYQTIINQNSK